MRKVTQFILTSIREVIFGLEDGLVSTLGVITGIAEGTQDRFVIILSGIVVIAVESLSMAAGTYLSNKSEQEARVSGIAKRTFYRIVHREENGGKNPARDAAVMGVAYLLAGAVPVVPYLVFSPGNAIGVSVVATILTLFLIGVGKGKVTNTNPVRSGLEMAIVSLSAAALGFTIGKAAAVLFPQLKT